MRGSSARWVQTIYENYVVIQHLMKFCFKTCVAMKFVDDDDDDDNMDTDV